MIDPRDAGEIHTLDTQTGQMSRHSIKDSLKGMNPALFPFSFYQFDMTSYYHYNFDDNRLKLSRQSFRLKGITINRAVQLSEKKYATLGFFRTGLLGLYDEKSREMNYYGHYPRSVYIPMEPLAMARIVQSFQGNIAYSEKYSKVIYCSFNFAYIACYQFTGRKLKFVWEHHIVPPPEVSVVDGYLKREQQEQQGNFSGVTIAGDYIFACYSQKSVVDTMSVNTHQILVYNMKGVQVATFHIDHPLSDIAVDMEEKIIYGISFVYDPVIVRFRFDDDMLQQ